MSITTELVVILVLVLANGIFAGAEIAILSVRKTRLRELAAEGSHAARALVGMRAHPENFLATVQIGITVVGATAAAFGGATLSRALGTVLERAGLGAHSENLSLAAVIGLISYLSLVLGELVPKSLALRGAERYALLIARPLRAVGFIARPIVWFLTASSNLVLRAFGDSTTFAEAQLSKEELQQLVDEAALAGALDPMTGEIARRALQFGEVRIAAVMVPRQRIVALSREATAEQMGVLLATRGHSRVPIYANGPEDIVGYVTSRDLFALLAAKDGRSLADILRPPRFELETKLAVDVLRDLQRTREQLVFVVDEHGSVSGIATMEDLVEELVGEIFAEHDLPAPSLRREDDGSALVRGTVRVHDINRDLHVDLPEGRGWVTIGGLVSALAGRVPEVGTRLMAGTTPVEIVEATDRRVISVRVHPSTSMAPS